MAQLRRLVAVALAIALLPVAAFAQGRSSITGQVVDAGSRQPIAGAQVRVAGTALQAVTGTDGRFTIEGVATGSRTVQANRVGYREGSATVSVGATPASVTLALQADALGLEELVVVGYGEQRRRQVAGAVSSLRPDAVQDAPIASINNALQGRLAGVQVFQNSGTPGSAISVRVRGSSSISAGNQPLYVVDGVPMSQGNFSQLANRYGGQDTDALSDLNPSEIESIEVLKDASAAAIYGSRASNGVVLITTKRGRAGNAEINFGSYYGTQEMWRKIDLLNTDQYIQIYNEGVFNRFGIRNAYGYEDDGVDNSFGEVKRGVDTDWIDQVTRTAPIYNVEGSVRGGSERARYYVAGSAFDQQGIVSSMAYKRLNGRVNLDYVPSDRLTLGTNVALARGVTDRNRSDNTIYGPFANALANPPIEPIYNDDGTYYNTLYANPVGLNVESLGEERSIRILGNTFARYSLTDWLSARASTAVDQLTLRSRFYDSPVVGAYTASGGSADEGNSFVSKVTYEGTLNFNRLVGDQHDFSGVAGASYEDNTEHYNRVFGQGFPGNEFKYLNSAAQINAGGSSLTRWALQSYFGRLSYTFADRITTTFNVRRDGSSRFGEANRFGTFPSASLLWRVGDEAFMQNQGFLNNLAVRVSYGRTGNQQDIGNFASRGLFAGGFNYNDQPGIAPTQLANPELRWETTDQFNAGTDFAILGDRLSFSFDYYVKKTDDLLVARPVPRTTGFSTIWSNVGSMENRGYEVTTRAQLIQGGSRGLNWTADFNVSRNRNEVTALYNNEPFMSGFASRVEVGQPIGVFYGFVTEGIFQNASEICLDARGGQFCAGKHAYQGSSRTAPGDIRFKDINGRDASGKLTGQPDGIINDDDRTYIGSPWPEYEGGLTNTLNFRGIDLSVFTQFSQGNNIYNANRIYMDQFGSFGDNHTIRAMQRWTPENPNATEPRAVWGDPNRNTRISDRFVEDGSYVRIKNATLGFAVPGSLANRMGFRSARVYVQGQNLVTWTEYSGFDPEVNYSGGTSVTRGTDFYTLPQNRAVTFGFNVGF